MSITGQSAGTKATLAHGLREGEAPTTGESRAQEISVQEMLMPVIRHWRWVGAFALAAFVAFAGSALMRPRTYTASASFLPQGSGAESNRLAGLAAAFGLAQGGRGGDSPALYVDLLESRRVLETVARSPFAFDVDGKRHSGTLIQLLGLEATPSEAAGSLKGAISINNSRRSGIIEISVTAPWGALAEQIAARLLEVTNEFSGEIRRSQATSERQFVEARMTEAGAKLAAAEGDLANFLQRNRQFRNAPELMFEHDRLQRKVAARQDLSTALSNTYEQARIEEVRNTPVMTILERPVSSRRPNPRGVVSRGAVGLILGAFVGLLFGVLTTTLRRARADERETVPEASRWSGEGPLRGDHAASTQRRPADLLGSAGLAAVSASPTTPQSTPNH